jgi:hypothetical protein
MMLHDCLGGFRGIPKLKMKLLVVENGVCEIAKIFRVDERIFPANLCLEMG